MRSDRLDVGKLEPGDVLLLVHPTENPAEGPIGTLDGSPVWVWHTGLYAGGGKWLVGDHFAGKVIETDLAKYLADYALRLHRGVRHPDEVAGRLRRVPGTWGADAPTRPGGKRRAARTP